MDTIEHWDTIKKLFKASFRSSFHYSIATVNTDGSPHVTPIGSVILGQPGQAIYFEEFPSTLTLNLQHNNRVSVLAVNSGSWFWLKSLIAGNFHTPPGVRLYGNTGELRKATPQEVALWQKRVRSMRFSKGHKLMWQRMAQVRDIHFTHFKPINLGEMTDTNWRSA